MDALIDDLAAEHAELDAVLVTVDDWDRATPAEGWSVRDTVNHLWFYDRQARLALDDADAFAAASPAPGPAPERDELHACWRRDALALVERARTVDASARIPWYGPAMSARSFVTARLMETWAHGYDIADAVGHVGAPTDRLRHVAHVGVRARPYSYTVRGLAAPVAEVRVELAAPSGATWTWGAGDAIDRVVGAALDFCLVVTRRRRVADTSLSIEGPVASEWMPIAQAFAGPPGPDRPPLTRR